MLHRLLRGMAVLGCMSSLAYADEVLRENATLAKGTLVCNHADEVTAYFLLLQQGIAPYAAIRTIPGCSYLQKRLSAQVFALQVEPWEQNGTTFRLVRFTAIHPDGTLSTHRKYGVFSLAEEIRDTI